MESKQLRISYLFGGASILLGLVFVADTLLTMPGDVVSAQSRAAVLLRSTTIDAICAMVEAALGVLIICFEKHGRKTAVIPFAFALLFASSAALNFRSATAERHAASIRADSPAAALP
jgi:hypothetical protein